MEKEEFIKLVESGSDESKEFIKKASMALFKQQVNNLGFDVTFNISEDGQISGKIT
jgi:hypothetical protein